MSPLRFVWSRLPRSARREALFSIAAALAPRIARPAPPAVLPLTVAGYFSATTGLGAAARRLVAGLRDQGFAVGEADLTGPLRQGPAGPKPAVAPGPGTLLVHVNGPMLPWALLSLGRKAVAGKRVVGVWNWELPVLPRDWDRGFAACHAIWAGTEFVAAACRRPGGPPVEVVSYPLPRPAPSGLGRRGLRPAGGGLRHTGGLRRHLLPRPQEPARRHRGACPGLRRQFRSRAW